MALQKKTLLTEGSVLARAPRRGAKMTKIVKMASGSSTLPDGTPLARNSSTGFWVPWSKPTNEVNTITANATPATAGTFTLTVDGATTATIAFDATAAAVQSALEALSNVRPGDVTAVQTAGTDLGDASAVVTLTWGQDYQGMDVAITADMSGLTGNAHVLATSTAGVGANDTDKIRAFLYQHPDGHVLNASGETLAVALWRGMVNAVDANTAAIRAVLGGSPSESDVQAALKDQAPSLRSLGIDVTELEGIY